MIVKSAHHGAFESTKPPQIDETSIRIPREVAKQKNISPEKRHQIFDELQLLQILIYRQNVVSKINRFAGQQN